MREDLRTVITTLQQIGTLSVSKLNSLHTVQITLVIISPSINTTHRFVVKGTTALSLASSQVLRDQLRAVQHTLVLESNTAQRANGGKLAITGTSRRSVRGCIVSVARSVRGEFNVSGLHPTTTTVSHAVFAADWLVAFFAVEDDVAVFVEEFCTGALMFESDAGLLEGANVDVGFVVFAANGGVSEGAVEGLVGCCC